MRVEKVSEEEGDVKEGETTEVEKGSTGEGRRERDRGCEKGNKKNEGGERK